MLKLCHPIKGCRCFLEQETLLSLLSTGWFQEQIQACFQNPNKTNWRSHLLKCQKSPFV